MFGLTTETALLLTALLLLLMTVAGLVFTIMGNRARRRRAALDLPKEDAAQIRQLESRLDKLVSEVRKLLHGRTATHR